MEKVQKSSKKVLTWRKMCDIMGKVKQVDISTSTKRKRKARKSFEVACTASEYIFKTLRINNLELTMKRF